MFDSAAAIGIILGSTWFMTVPEPSMAPTQTFSASYMTDVLNRKWDLSLTREKSVGDVAYQSKPTSFYGLRYGASAMTNAQGTFMVGPGVGKTIDAKNLKLTLFIYPSYSEIRGTDRIKSLSGNFNWRTTFDVTYPVGEKSRLGVGLMHISNGGYSLPNSGLEAFRFTWTRDF